MKNTFTFQFETRSVEGGGIERRNMKQKFTGQQSLINGDKITPLGYKILVISLADNIKQLAAMAAGAGLDPMELIADAGKRLRILQEAPKEQLIETPQIILQ